MTRLVTTGELGDQRRRTTCIDCELTIERVSGHACRIATEPVRRRGHERVSEPAARVVDQDVNRAQLGLGEIEQTNRRVAVGEIGFDRYRVAAVLANDVEHRLRICGTIVAIRVRNAGIDSVSESQVKARDARNAIDAVLGGSPVPVEATTVVGCTRAVPSSPSRRHEEIAKIEAEPVALKMAGSDELKKLRANPTGKLLLVNFWATWCGPCVTEFPELQTTFRMYRNRGFDFVSVSSNDPEEKPQVIEFLQKYHSSSTNYQFATSDTFDLQADFDPAMPAAVPFTVLIAPNGDVLFQQLGELDFLKLRRAILANLPDDAQHPGQQAYWSH